MTTWMSLSETSSRCPLFLGFKCTKSYLLYIVLIFFCVCVRFISAGLLTLCGVSLYIIYSDQALAATESLVGPEGLAYIHISFGWSFGLAWLSYSLEVLTSVLLLTAAHSAKLQHSSPTIA